jgi:hypothetical protein
MEQKHTHLAVHAIQYRNDKGESVEIAPKAEFTPKDHGFNAEATADLVKRGAARKLTREDLADDAATVVKTGK